MPILPQFQQLLKRRNSAIIHFNDVFTDREIDFDAELTVTMRNLGQLSDRHFPIGQNPRLADYGANLMHDLLLEKQRLLALTKTEHSSEQSIICLINCAPRNLETTQNGQNGQDFHLAITTAGLEIYAVPLTLLSTLEARHQILALYRIPTANHPFFDGEHEQFRSSIIATTRFAPEILDPIFQYPNQNSLIEAKISGKHPQLIPLPTKPQIAYRDKFGNVRLAVPDLVQFTQQLQPTHLHQQVKLCFANSPAELRAFYVNSLKEIPQDQLGLYSNVADPSPQANSQVLPQFGYLEIAKKSATPNQELHSAAAQLTAIASDPENLIWQPIQLL